MKTKTSLMITGALLALSLISGASAFAETATVGTMATENPVAETQAFLASPTSLSKAIATAETAAGGKVSTIEYQNGENGAPDLIMADVALADGTSKTVAINPADGKVMNVTVAENDQQDGQQDGGTDTETGGQDGENANN